MRLNPFSFGAAGYPLCGAEEYLYSVLASSYKHFRRVVKGDRISFLDAVAAREDNRFSRSELDSALVNITDGLSHGRVECKPLVKIENGMVTPTEHFGILPDPPKVRP
jgi:hypothetical protein